AIAFTGTGNASNNVITGGGGDDTLSGLGGNDTLNGGDNNDTLNGGAGDDTLSIAPAAAASTDELDVVFNGTSITSVEGGSVTGVEFVNANLNGGNDTLLYTGSTAAVSVNLATGSASGFASIANIENVTGGSGNDTVIGSDLVSNNLSGGDGEDTLNGGTDNDTLAGGNGNDTYIANNGDTLQEAAAGGTADQVFTSSATFT